MSKEARGSFDIGSFESRLAAKNRFDPDLSRTETRLSQGGAFASVLGPEDRQFIEDTGRDRYVRMDGVWEAVPACPLCGSVNRELFTTRMGLEIQRCAECSHRYLSPRLQQGRAEELYRSDRTSFDIYTQPAQTEIDEIKYQYGLNLIDQLDPPARARIMDVGCGAGVFLKMAERNGWEECVGIDLNERYASIYQGMPGIQFLNSSFENLDEARIGGDYDCIALWSVLEHLYNLHPTIESLKRLLKPRGLLFVLVPNADSLATRLMREKSPTYGWKHLSHFTPATLRRLMDMHGLTCEFHETVISEIDNIKSYMSGEYPYHGYGDPKGLFEFVTPDWLHRNFLGSRQIAVFRKP